MRKSILFVFITFFFQACSTTIPVRESEPLNSDRIFNFAQLNSRVAGAETVVRCTNGTSFSSFELHVTPDSTTFSDIGSGLRHSIATRDVLSIERKDHASGVWTGTFLGTLAGIGVAGAIIALRTSDDEPAPLIIALLAIPLGTISGAVIGRLQGNTQEFTFSARQTPKADSVKVQTIAPKQ